MAPADLERVTDGFVGSHSALRPLAECWMHLLQDVRMPQALHTQVSQMPIFWRMPARRDTNATPQRSSSH